MRLVLFLDLSATEDKVEGYGNIGKQDNGQEPGNHAGGFPSLVDHVAKGTQHHNVGDNGA